MKEFPTITRQDGAAFWSHTFDTFDATVYVPSAKPELLAGPLNYGFSAPYLLVFAEKKLSYDEAAAFAREKGFEEIAASFASSVVFIYPTAEGGWKNASPAILSEIITNSRIHEYYEDGAVKAVNRFTKTIDGYFIHGAIFRTCLYGFGESADYIARNCLNHFEGDGLWGRSDLAPVTVTLTGLSVLPEIDADDIPVVSYGNSEAANEILRDKCTYFIERDEPAFVEDCIGFAKQFRRMIGHLDVDPDLEADGLIREPFTLDVTTSPDNCGDDKGTARHTLGCFAFYNEGLFDAAKAAGKKVPLVLGFHGGGDSCFFFSTMAGWAKICHRHDFLLVTVENHLNSTATEMLELIEYLKKTYPVDETRIYVTGFSMGGCKTWDFVQEHPDVLAACAPMDATFEVGLNLYGQPLTGTINTSVPVPTFYTGGEVTPLPELPFQAQKCVDRMKYALDLNGASLASAYTVKLEDAAGWKNKIWGIDGDIRYTSYDKTRDATLTCELFRRPDGKIWNVFGSISGQGHDCREHTCEHAWRYMSLFSRAKDGTVIGGEEAAVLEALGE